MSEENKKRSLLPNLELLIVIVFFFSFLMFAIPKCNQTQTAYDNAAKEAEEDIEISEPTNSSIKEDSIKISKTANDSLTATPTINNTSAEESILNQAPIENNTFQNNYATKLYVTIDQLNLRKGPHLDSAIVIKLPLFEEVFFLNEITDYTEKISLGPEIADEPWIKIQTKSGKQGWVYGAGVYYYKRKRLPDEIE